MDSKTFGRKLMYQWEMDAATQRAFDNHAGELGSRFSVRGSEVANGARVDFRNYIDHLRVAQGLPAAFERLEELRGTGLTAELYATAGMTMARRAGEYGVAADFLLGAHNRWPENTAILVFLIETLISADRVEEAVTLLEEVNRQQQLVPVSPAGLKLAEFAAVCGVWPEAERLLASLAPDPEGIAERTIAKRIELAMQYSGQSAELPVYVLNMPEDRRKLGLLTNLYRKFEVLPRRHEGVDGRSIPPADVANVAAHRGLRIGNGALACALGHISMWKQFLAGQNSHALILEDDGLPYTWRDLSSVAASAGSFDVLFVNERMSAIAGGKISTDITTVWEALGTKPDSARGWGTDGYMLSRKGAEKLLEAISVDKVLSHIDGQIAAYGIPTGADPQNEAQRVGLSVRRTSRYAPTLNIKCLDFPLVASMDFGDSTIGRVSGHQL